MKHFFALLALCYSTLLVAQSVPSLSFSLHYGAGAVDRYEDVLYVSEESAAVSHQLSLQSRLETGRRLKPFAGLTWSVYRLRTRVVGLTFGDMIDPQNGFIYDTSSEPIHSVSITRQYQYLRLPLGVNLTLGNAENQHMEIQFSVSPDVLLRSHGRRVIAYNNRKDIWKGGGYDPDLSTWGMTTQMDVQYAKPLSTGLVVLAGLSLQGTPVSVYQDKPGEMRWFYAGGNVGIRF